jgi:predicted RNA-binding protein with PUA-like domain
VTLPQIEVDEGTKATKATFVRPSSPSFLGRLGFVGSRRTLKRADELASAMPRYWLLKSEPEAYSIDDLERDGSTFWNGVRNHAARNFMRDEMKPGDLAFFYRSNAEPSGVVGVMEVVSAGTPDPTQFDKKGGEDMGYDPKATRAKPIWFGVEVAFRERLARVVSLAEIKATPALAQMKLLKVSRLSICPVTAAEWKAILKMAARPSRRA